MLYRTLSVDFPSRVWRVQVLVARILFAALAICLISAVPGCAEENLRATLEVKATRTQVVGVPLLMQLVVKNTGTEPIVTMCSGPALYPDAQRFEAVITDERGHSRRVELSNGQGIRGTRDSIVVQPGKEIVFPAAIAALPAGKFTLRSVIGAPEEHGGGPGGRMAISWPAMESKAALPLEVREDPEAARKFGLELLERVRQSEPFARHVATEFRVAAVIEAMVKDLDSDDTDVAYRAAETLFHLREFPNGLGIVIRRAVLKHLQADRVPQESDLLAYLCALAEQEGSDESLEAVLALVSDGMKQPEHCRPLQSVGSFQQPKAAEVLRGYLTSPDSWVRFTAASGLSKHHDPAAVPVLIQLFKDARSAERADAFSLLADYSDDPRALAAIDEGTKDPDADVRKAAADAKRNIELWKTGTKKD